MTIPNFAAAILLGLLTRSLQGAEWQPVAGNLMTRWAAEVDPQAPLPDYERWLPCVAFNPREVAPITHLSL